MTDEEILEEYKKTIYVDGSGKGFYILEDVENLMALAREDEQLKWQKSFIIQDKQQIKDLQTSKKEGRKEAAKEIFAKIEAEETHFIPNINEAFVKVERKEFNKFKKKYGIGD